jgi:PAS domain S-box-containing protein
MTQTIPDKVQEPLLLVDDEEGIRTVLGLSLADAGYVVHTAADGEAALALFEKVHPTIVLTDIKMPGMDGIELLGIIKERSPDTEVIMITGHGDMELAIESLKLEATDFVTKPVNPDVLEIALKRATDRLAMRRQLKQYTENLETLVDEQSRRLVELERLTAIGQAVEGMSAALGDITGGLIADMNLLDEMPCFVAVHNRDLKVVNTNQLYRERLGNRVGQDSCGVYPPEEEGNSPCPVARTLETGSADRCKATVCYANGERWPVVVHTAPICNSRGELELVLEIAADVSEIRRLQKSLETTQRRYQQLFDEVPCYISVLDRQFQVVASNRDYQESFGRLDGRRCFQVFKQRETVCDNCPAAATFDDGQGRQRETVLTNRHGERRNVLVRTTPIRNSRGEVDQVMEMATDITELRLLQDNLSALGLMVGAVSHGVKGILTGLDAGLYLIETGRDKQLPDRIDRGVDRVRVMTDRIRKVVLDLLYCAKERPPQYATIDSEALVADLRSVIAPKLEGHAIALKTEVAPDAADFDGDEAHLHTALVNILDNAVEACLGDAARTAHTVRLTVAADGPDHITITVADDGPGMDTATRERLFDLFFSSKADKGTGLGLFLAQKAVSQHSGQISVDADPGQGARFSVRLPRRRSQSEPAALAE